MARRFGTLVLALLLALPALAAEERPAQVIERLNAGLLEIMRNAEALGYAGRVERFALLLPDTYNLEAMARGAVGPQWQDLSGDERARIVDVFARMTESTYASRFNGYSGESFEVLGEEPSAQDLMVVASRLVKANGEAVELNYAMKSFDGKWRVIDVYLEAKYSELARLRAEFGSVLRREGVDALIARIEAKIRRTASQGG